MAKLRYVSNVNTADSTSRIVLETDEAGEPTKWVDMGDVVDLTAAQRDSLSGMFNFEDAEGSAASSQESVEAPTDSEQQVQPGEGV